MINSAGGEKETRNARGKWRLDSGKWREREKDQVLLHT